jgi:hypothetical protein
VAAEAAAADTNALLCVSGLKRPIDCINAAKQYSRSIQHMLASAGPSADPQLGKAMLLFAACSATATPALVRPPYAVILWFASNDNTLVVLQQVVQCMRGHTNVCLDCLQWQVTAASL